ncbi:hypothetical protein RyT2_18660 [Pseudolactococcus yaeyamensis]
MKNRKNVTKLTVALVGFMLLVGSTSAVTHNVQADLATVPVQFLGVNDVHGQLPEKAGSYYDNDKNKTSDAGGAAILASYLNQAQTLFETAKGVTANTIRVQAGDMVGASPAVSGLLQDEPTIKAMKAMNFTIGTIGNHEFDEGLAEFSRIINGQAPISVAQFGQAVYNYPRVASGQEIVVANVLNKSDGQIPYGFRPYTIKEVAGQKIGFIGIVTTEIPNLVLKKHIADYDFLDEAETIVKYEKELRAQGINAIVVVAHTPVETVATETRGDSVTIVEKINALDPENSVDIYFGAHNHKYAKATVGDTVIVQSTSQTKGYIDIQGEIDTTTHDFTGEITAAVAPVKPIADGETLNEDGLGRDPEVQAIIGDANARIASVVAEKIGQVSLTDPNLAGDAETGFSVPGDRNIATKANKETILGNLVTDAQRLTAKENGYPDIDFAMTNNGGIRADLKVESDGSILWGSAQAVQPFGNIMQVVEMTGEQIKAVLEQQSNSYYLQISGLTYTYLPKADATNGEIAIQTLSKADGTPILPDKTYQVVINDFLFGGGDGFTEFVGSTLLGAIDPDTETFVNYLKAQTPTVTIPSLGRKIPYVTPTTYTITYELNGGEVAKDAPTTYTSESDTILLPTPTREGYKFTGWMQDGKVVTEIAKGSTGDVTLVATWQQEQVVSPVTVYKIVYQLEGGKFNQDVPTTYTSESDTILLPTPTREGYKFTGWRQDGKVVTEIAKGSTGDVTLVATWQVIATTPTLPHTAQKATQQLPNTGATTGTTLLTIGFLLLVIYLISSLTLTWKKEK